MFVEEVYLLLSLDGEMVSADQMDVECLNVSGVKLLKETHCNGTTRWWYSL